LLTFCIYCNKQMTDMYSVSKKQYTRLLTITSENVERFSMFLLVML